VWKVELVVGFGGGFSWGLSGFVWLLAVVWQCLLSSGGLWWVFFFCFEAGGRSVLGLLTCGWLCGQHCGVYCGAVW